ncbi:helix-turn-helix transcriptional regulator (plasmid) [Paracoccus methylovorus]|uniref:Helix-turn-helix transcriptional regulator n=1 Tax=Paracoccus methylovorus TaxID=2812658 RepID=A0ABX7JP65_9RHOB|nr:MULTISPECIES: helix-turn-helix transcriptional regulator [Paracoccus]QRZ16072.1 helix-turn-helix transcriptional regulator [Paracoccus methylovorus]
MTPPDLSRDAADRIASFAANLRLLCDRQGSISQICRKLGINRQQFNKYLSGRHMPSSGNIRLIANYFGLGPEVLFSEHERFRALVDGNFFDVLDHLRRAPQVARFLDTVAVSTKIDMGEYVGCYDRYQYSSIYARKILRSAFCIFQSGDFLNHYYIERFPSYDDPSRTEYIFKYHGFTFPVEDRVFTIDFETVQRNEFTFGIFSTVQRSAKRFMFGIVSGVAATMFRQPFSTRAVLHYRRPGLLSRAELQATTTLDMNDASIPREAREYLGESPDMIKPV